MRFMPKLAHACKLALTSQEEGNLAEAGVHTAWQDCPTESEVLSSCTEGVSISAMKATFQKEFVSPAKHVNDSMRALLTHDTKAFCLVLCECSMSLSSEFPDPTVRVSNINGGSKYDARCKQGCHKTSVAAADRRVGWGVGGLQQGVPEGIRRVIRVALPAGRTSHFKDVSSGRHGAISSMTASTFGTSRLKIFHSECHPTLSHSIDCCLLISANDISHLKEGMTIFH